jgi:transposase-like protein
MPLDMFGTDRREKDGKNRLCRACLHRKYVREYAEIKKDPERYAALLEQRRKNSEDYRRKRGARKVVRHEVPEGMKRCPRCGKIMPREVFRGASYCPDCRRAYNRERWEAIKASDWMHERFLQTKRRTYKLKKLYGNKGMGGRPTDAERPRDRG